MVQFKVFTLDANNYTDEQEVELNAFLKTHRILQVNEYFVPNTGALRFSVKYEAGENEKPKVNKNKERKDYKAILSDEDYALYDKMRLARNMLADELAVQKYTICLNESLYNLALSKPKTVADLNKVKGLEPNFLKNYSVRWFDIVNKLLHEENAV